MWPLLFYCHLSTINTEYFPVCVELMFLDILLSSRESIGENIFCFTVCVFFKSTKRTLSCCFTEEAIGKSADQGKSAETVDELNHRLSAELLWSNRTPLGNEVQDCPSVIQPLWHSGNFPIQLSSRWLLSGRWSFSVPTCAVGSIAEWGSPHIASLVSICPDRGLYTPTPFTTDMD